MLQLIIIIGEVGLNLVSMQVAQYQITLPGRFITRSSVPEDDTAFIVEANQSSTLEAPT